MRLIFQLISTVFVGLLMVAPLTYSQNLEPPRPGANQQTPLDNLDKSFLNLDLENAPTYIKADLLTLKNKERVFQYSNNVEIKQADLTITSATLEGGYNEENKIEWMEAKTNVVITKGATIRARGELARYELKSKTIVLTNNPELQQDGSVLTADSITIFLNEDRSVAEGSVRVKLIDKEKDNEAIMDEQQEEALSESSE